MHPQSANLAPFVLVLANLSDTAEQVAQTAAMVSAPLRGQLVLLHVSQVPVLAPELVSVPVIQSSVAQAQAATVLQAIAHRLPPAVKAEVLVSVKALPEALADAVRRYQPLLLVMGLSTEPTLLDELLHNQMLPALQATQLPLLLVPAQSTPGMPRRVALAVDAQEFTPNAATLAIGALLQSWPATYTVVHVAAKQEQQAFPGQRALGIARASQLLAERPLELYEAHHMSAAAGVLQAIDDIQADLLVLPTRPGSWLSRLFHRSVTAQVLRHARVPVLLLPAAAHKQPGWMPNVC